MQSTAPATAGPRLAASAIVIAIMSRFARAMLSTLLMVRTAAVRSTLLALGAAALAGSGLFAATARARSTESSPSIKKMFEAAAPVVPGAPVMYEGGSQACPTRPGPLRAITTGKSSLRTGKNTTGPVDSAGTLYFRLNKPANVRFITEIPPTGARASTTVAIKDCGIKVVSITTREDRPPGVTSSPQVVSEGPTGPGLVRLRIRANGKDIIVTRHGKPDAVRYHQIGLIPAI